MGFSDDSSSSSSGSGYSSDDEYLAGGTGGGDASGGAGGSATEAEREAMIRKKLLESFYGTAAGGGGGSAGDDDDEDDGDGDGGDGGGETTSASASGAGGAPPLPPPRHQQQHQQKQHGGLYSRPSPRRTHRKVAPQRPSSDTGEDADDEGGTADDGEGDDGGANILREHAVHSTLSPRHPTSSSRGGGRDGGGTGSSPAATRHAPPPGSTNLDSPNFDAASYTRSLLLHSSTETLLAENEKLATDVRGLDSTMQTLVYENYSKFIDATDAIRSIGRSVDASENGLRRLAASMEKIERGTAGVDAALQKSREAVAEKLRVKRHLSRLDALLKLPSTLRSHVEAGRYRLAAKSHAGAAHILARHSGGFESLGRIEMECDTIMAEMGVDLNRKLRAWSDPIGGGIGSLVVGVDVVPPPKKVAEIFECAGTLLLLSERDGVSTSSPPTSPSTGCRGALLDPETKEEERGSDHEDSDSDDDGDEGAAGGGGDGRPAEGTGGTSAETIAPEEFKSLALVACRRLLERTLESPGGTDGDDESAPGGPLSRGISLSTRGTSGASTAANTPNLIFPQALSMFPTTGGEDDDDASAARKKRLEVAVVPKAFLDGLLDAATLFGVTFGGSDGGTSSGVENGRLLGEFVSDLFASFLTHARRRLLEKSVEAERRQNELREKREREREVAGGDDAAALPKGDDLAAAEEELKLLEDKLPTFEKALEDDAHREKPTSFDEVSSDLVHLGRSVRELASGLALPEVGIDVTVASSLVDRTLSLTESIVRRQVAAHFHHLRSVTVKKCLAPFVLSATEMTTAGVVTSLANVLVEDALREVDGALVDVAEMMADAPVDPATVRGAAERCAVRHAAWFAGSLERVAGCDYTGAGGAGTTVLDVRDDDDGDASDADGDGGDGGLVGGESSPLSSPAMDGGTVRGAGGRGGEILDEVMSELDFGGDGGDGDGDDGGDDEDDPLRPLLDDLENRTGLFAADAAVPDDVDGGHSHPHLTLSVAEACRLAGGRAGDAIEDSVAAVLGPRGNNGQSPGRGHPSMMASVAESSPTTQVSDRFERAAGRVLSLYATDRGGEAVRNAWEAFFNSSPAPWSHVDDPGEAEYYTPRTSTCRILEIARVTSVDWADAFGGDRSAGPVPTFGEDEMLDGLAPPMHSYHTSGGGTGHHHLAADGISRGLQLDVERMFAEKTPVYRTVNFDRDSVVSVALGMALKAMAEYVRLCVFSVRGYRQLQVDAELLRRGVSHYVGGDRTGALYGLLDDALRGASERCPEMQERGEGDVPLEEDVVLSYVRAFLDDNPNVPSEIFVSDEAMVDEDV